MLESKGSGSPIETVFYLGVSSMWRVSWRGVLRHATIAAVLVPVAIPAAAAVRRAAVHGATGVPAPVEGPATAHANGLSSSGPQIGPAMLLALGSSSFCVTYTYDKNGNRTLQTTAAVNSGPIVWGAGVYGCFLWNH